MTPKVEPLHIVLVHPEIPQNTGNIGRTCVALGAKLWLVRPLGFRLDEHHLQRAGLDYWQHLEFEVVDHWAAITAMLSTDRMWYFSKSGNTHYTEVEYVAGDILVFGSETAGLPETIRSHGADRLLRIPMRQEARSLNLSNSVAIAAYEAIRQMGV